MKHVMNGIQLIAAERARQIQVEGWNAEHDQEHVNGELTEAAVCYAEAASSQIRGACGWGRMPRAWPWNRQWWKPSPEAVRNLVKSGALIAAEIDRLQGMMDAVSPAPSPSQPVVTCVYCGHQYPEGTPTHQAELLTAHIKTCQKHPLREAEIRLKRLGKALADLVDARTKDELDAMEGAMRIMPGIEADKSVGINAIHALQAELAAGADLS